MANISSVLARGASVVVAAALFGVMPVHVATAQVNPNCTETATLADLIYTTYNCAGSSANVCSLPTALNLCCTDNSPIFADQELCVCDTYALGETQRMRNDGFTAPSFCTVP